jgi:hypothetical protein
MVSLPGKTNYTRNLISYYIIVPLSEDHVLVRFVVSAGTEKDTDRIAVFGNCPALGQYVFYSITLRLITIFSGDMNQALIMQYTYPHWELELYVPKSFFPLE